MSAISVLAPRLVSAGANITASRVNWVAKLAAGSNTQTYLPFTGLNEPHGVAVDNTGSVYVADQGNNRVLKLTANNGIAPDSCRPANLVLRAMPATVVSLRRDHAGGEGGGLWTRWSSGVTGYSN